MTEQAGVRSSTLGQEQFAQRRPAQHHHNRHYSRQGPLPSGVSNASPQGLKDRRAARRHFSAISPFHGVVHWTNPVRWPDLTAVGQTIVHRHQLSLG
jgi:hypothetical protein